MVGHNKLRMHMIISREMVKKNKTKWYLNDKRRDKVES